ncbi:MAG: hypothetical protein IBX58_06505 [Roseovarius sp.]|nr:hypothetical protein [Roseovarius sp.]
MAEAGRRRKQTKDSQLVIRIPKADRDAFVDLCDALDTSAAREIRRFIREFTEAHWVSPGEVPPAIVGAAGSEKKSRKKKAKRAGKS